FEIAHFRDPTTHAFLNSFLAPPPHTIVGLLGGLSGLDERLTEDMCNKLRVGCIILRVNGFLKDLALMENQKNRQVIKFPRTRRFLVDPKYRIYIGSEEIDLISNLLDSVHLPKHTPYLGISDCLAYIRDISNITETKVKKLKETSSVVNLTEGIRYTTLLKEANTFTIFPEIVESPTSYELTPRGRIPNYRKKFLMSVNCKISFKEPIEGYEIDGEDISTIPDWKCSAGILSVIRATHS
ncbi:MAG: CRISPR-associated protein Cas5, partial [Nitrososphaeraceae archaeon]